MCVGLCEPKDLCVSVRGLEQCMFVCVVHVCMCGVNSVCVCTVCVVWM